MKRHLHFTKQVPIFVPSTIIQVFDYGSEINNKKWTSPSC
jgi:hypothetical protein